MENQITYEQYTDEHFLKCQYMVNLNLIMWTKQNSEGGHWPVFKTNKTNYCTFKREKKV